ncbi:MAG: peptide ABC transporter permease [Desulfobacteraceae bacterium 4484_190.1]|nr:MAG: peptide ABC transporter permease [Desulfobacteraceae bacterium 4484_190.1]
MRTQGKKNELLYFASRNRKFLFGASTLLFFILVAVVGPMLTKYPPGEYVASGPQPPSSEHWLGTTTFGQDVFSQFVYGLRASFLVGLVGGGLGTVIGLLVGLTAGYYGGFLDELLNMLTNIVLVIPTMAILLIIAAYLKVRSVLLEGFLIGFTSWPWVAKAVRGQVFSLREREFINLAKISGMPSWKIIFEEIISNMLSYIFMVFVLQFGGAILSAATLDFIGLGPTKGFSLGLMMNYALLWNALQLGMWWWFVPPGLAITILVGALYIMNVGLDEVFNPKLREK